MRMKKCPQCSAVNYGDAFNCRCGYEFLDGEELETMPDQHLPKPSAHYVHAALVSGVVGALAALLIGNAVLKGVGRSGQWGDYFTTAVLFAALLAVVFFATLLLSRVLASRETGWGMKIFALLLFGLGTVVLAVAIFVVGCAASFHIGG